MENETTILLVEDDLLTLRTNKRLLISYGKVLTASNSFDAEQIMIERKIDVSFFDLNLDGELEGLNLIKKAQSANIYSIVVSGESREDVLHSAFENGAKDYLLKPFNNEKLIQVIQRFFNSKKHLEFENLINKAFITKSQAQVEEIYKIKNLTISDKPVFINGETGTGKRVIAHLIKEISQSEKFIEVNCSQFTDELIASELFGHTKGSFTGAHNDKIGLLEEAHNGIVFLDEIHALSLKSQKTLLKAIEEKEFFPVGSNRLVKSNFRVVSATCENMEELIGAGKFREDLFARISTFQINLLSLKERKEDIGLLFDYFISKHLVQILITKEARKILDEYAWPRNTREIQDLVENWVVNGNRLITPDILPNHIKNNLVGSNKLFSDSHLDLIEEFGLTEFLTYMKKELTLAMIKRNGGSMRKASKAMGASHSNISTFLKQNRNKELTIGRGNGKYS